MRWGKVPARELKERQGRLLHRFLQKKVYPYSPFYRRLFDEHGLKPDHFRTLEDLQRLPFTTKDDIAPTKENPTRYRDFILQPSSSELKEDLTLTQIISLWARKQIFARSIQDQLLDEYLPQHITFTTGRTSLPTPMLYTLGDMKLLREAGKRMFSVIGLDRREDRGLNAMPFAPHLAFWGVVAACNEVGLMVLHSGGGKVMGTERLLKLGENTKPTFLLGTPGYIMHLGNTGAEMGVRIESITKVVLGAERVSEEYKEKLRDVMAKLGSPGVKIFNVYGFTEAKRPWMETADAEDSRFATYPDMEVFEIIDPDTGEVVPDGEPGEVVYTHLSGAGSVVLRYRTGDRVREGLVYGRCPHTGLELPLLGTGLHRVSEIKKVKETLVDFNAMFSFFNSRQEIVEWQVVVRKQGEDGFGRDEILLRVALKDGTDETEFRESIAGNFRQLTEVSIDDVEFMGREELSELLGLESQAKESRIVDERDN